MWGNDVVEPEKKKITANDHYWWAHDEIGVTDGTPKSSICIHISNTTAD